MLETLDVDAKNTTVLYYVVTLLHHCRERILLGENEVHDNNEQIIRTASRLRLVNAHKSPSHRNLTILL